MTKKEILEEILKHPDLRVQQKYYFNGLCWRHVTLDEFLAKVDINACQCIENGKALNKCDECPR